MKSFCKRALLTRPSSSSPLSVISPSSSSSSSVVLLTSKRRLLSPSPSSFSWVCQYFSSSSSLRAMRGEASALRMQRSAARKKPAPVIAGANEDSPYIFDVSWAKLHKDQAEPELKSDAEYPDWIWDLDAQAPSLLQLQKEAERDFSSMSKSHKKRLFKLLRKQDIKQDNDKQ